MVSINVYPFYPSENGSLLFFDKTFDLGRGMLLIEGLSSGIFHCHPVSIGNSNSDCANELFRTPNPGDVIASLSNALCHAK